MSELLTTGQMIDQLKVGEVAEVANKPFEQLETKGKTVAYDQQGIKWQDSFQELFINSYTTKLMWTIRPKYVYFEEAMKALKEGSRIKWISPDGADSLIFVPKEYEEDFIDMSFRDILEGEWTIEEENNESK